MRRPGASRASVRSAGAATRSGDGLEGRDPHAPRRVAGRRGGERGRGAVGLLEQRARVPGEHDRRVGEPDAPAGLLQQRHAGLPLEHRELLGDRRRRVAQRVRHGRDRAAGVQLVEQAQPAQVEHPVTTLLNNGKKSSLLLTTYRGSMPAMPIRGIVLCLASAAAFGAMGVFGKRAYDEGATVGTLLAVRFAVAGVVLGGAAVATGALRGLARRDVVLAAGLGAIAYSAQAGAYFAALARIDAGLLSLLVYTFPAIVAVAAAALGRERAGRRTVAALALSSAGLVLVVAGAGAGALDPLGTALGLTAACVYAAYVLVSERVAQRLGPLALAALVCAGAAATLTLGAAATGELRPADVTPAGLGWLVAIALVSTVGALALFFAGLPLVGPTAASILSTAEPVTAVVLAFAVLGDTLGPVQLAGGALVLAAATVLTLARPQEQP